MTNQNEEKVNNDYLKLLNTLDETIDYYREARRRKILEDMEEDNLNERKQ